MTSTAKSRVIALGASNLTRLFPVMMRVRSAALREVAGGCEWLVAAGLGRSYGVRSRFLGRELPGIDRCGLWPALEAAPHAHKSATTGIVTDVGNDIFYGVHVDRILDWVAHCLERLRPLVSRLVVTAIPPSVFELGAFRFWIMRRVIVPSCKLDLEEGKRRAVALDEGLRSLAERYDAVFYTGERGWYGWDAIHVKRRHWRTFAEHVLGVAGGGLSGGALPRWSMRAKCKPELRWMFGREQRTEQPSLHLPDGSTASIY